MRILYIEDDPSLRIVLERLILTQGHQVTSCENAEEAWERYQQSPFNFIISDWMLPGMTGLEFCRMVRKHPFGQYTFVMLVTGNNAPGDLQKVLDAGADDYIAKPFDFDLFRIRLQVAANQANSLIKRREAEELVSQLRNQLKRTLRFHDFIGKSAAMQAVYQLIRDLAGVDSTVLVNGETGTGKELVARAIHQESNRKKGPFITVNCGGLAETLIASQLFGHRRGAFTGAVSDHRGVFEAANGGTLFLDEIGDLPLTLQAAFLRALEDRTITRVGETQSRKIDVRVVAATHRDLEGLVTTSNFRRDLLYRIRIGRILLPPLRERREDIPLLCEYFLKDLSQHLNKSVATFSPEALSLAMTHTWPGNVRELRNSIEFAMIRCKTSELRVEDLPPELVPDPAQKQPDLKAALPQDEQGRFLAALAQANGNRSKAAKLLGISRATFYRKLAAQGPDKG